MSGQPPQDFERLRALLIANETFPAEFPVKFVGKNSAAFRAGVANFAQEHPTLKETARRESAQGNHLAMTYILTASNADHIIAVLERVTLIEDVLIVL
jgi:putative lipoic acid-binding regulatory protein